MTPSQIKSRIAHAEEIIEDVLANLAEELDLQVANVGLEIFDVSANGTFKLKVHLKVGKMW